MTHVASPASAPSGQGARPPLDPNQLPTYGWTGRCVHVSGDPRLAQVAHPTIGHGVHAAQTQGIECVIIHPGSYEARFCIEHNLRLQGAGQGESLIQVTNSADDHGMCIHPAEVTFSDLTLVSVNGIGSCIQGTHPGSEISILRCHLNALGSKHAIRLWGGAKCTLHNSSFEGARVCGAVVPDKCVLEMHDSRCHTCSSPGIEVIDGGHATLKHCHVYECADAGIQVNGGGHATVEHCHVYECADAGIQVNSGGNATVEHCHVYECADAGIQVNGGGNATLKHCHVYECTDAGIQVNGGGNATLKHCHVYECTDAGIQVNDGGNATVEHCHVNRCTHAGIQVNDGGHATVESCHVNRCTHAGIQVNDGGHATVVRCHVSHNKGSAILASGTGAQLHGTGLLAYHNDFAGVYLKNKARGTLVECDLYANSYGCLVDDADVDVRSSHFSLNSNSGMYFCGPGLRGQVTGCSFVENGSWGIFCNAETGAPNTWSESKLLVCQCLFRTHHCAALYFGHYRSAQLTGCTMFGDGNHVKSDMALVDRNANVGTIPNDFRALMK